MGFSTAGRVRSMVGVVERHSGKKRATGKKGGWEIRKRAYFYAQENSICQLLRDENLDGKLLERVFFSFFLKK